MQLDSRGHDLYLCKELNLIRDQNSDHICNNRGINQKEHRVLRWDARTPNAERKFVHSRKQALQMGKRELVLLRLPPPAPHFHRKTKQSLWGILSHRVIRFKSLLRPVLFGRISRARQSQANGGVGNT